MCSSDLVLQIVGNEATNRTPRIPCSSMGSSDRGISHKKSFSIRVEDVYFLIGFSRRGLPISLTGSTVGGEIVRDYVMQYCYPGLEPSKYGKINIQDVRDLPLRTILFTITKLVGTITLHVANRSYMQYALECLEPTFFNWSEVFLSQIKEQLNKAKGGRKKNFSYGSILISFALERIPLMQPQHVTLDISSPKDPRM